MHITREHFDNDRLSAMDEIAVCILAMQTLRAAGEAFENTEDLRKSRTLEKAEPVFAYLETTASALLTAICRGKTNRALDLAEARKLAEKELIELMPMVESLVRQEVAFLNEIAQLGGNAGGASLRILMLEPLTNMLKVWSATKV